MTTEYNKNFQCELSYMKGEEGSADQKQVKETYIFRAVNYGDADWTREV